MKHGLAIVITFLLLASCGGVEQPGTEATTSETHSIGWYEGTVESAFELAEETGRPLFLYWGAEWCPPCHYLKEKIFKRPEFVAKMAEFIPVYLDGDSERAQIWGEKLDTQGYPTVIVFDSGGEELIRMPSDVPMEDYSALLDIAVGGVAPAASLIARVTSGDAASLSPAERRVLAYYSWSQAPEGSWGEGSLVDAFRALYETTPAEMPGEQARFLLLLLENGIDHDAQDADGTGEQPVFTSAERDEYTRGLIAVLEDRSLRNRSLGFLFFGAREVIEFLQPNGTELRDQLMDVWETSARAVEEDSELAADDRLSALVPQITLARWRAELADGTTGKEGQEVELPQELVDHVAARVAEYGSLVSEKGELQTVVNTMAYLLDVVGLTEESEALLSERMGDTQAPYYFMSWMAGIKREQGKTEEAVDWYRKAYESSRGRYSRFRWGSIYLRRLMELAPDDAGRIESETLKVLGELMQLNDAFAGGNHSRLRQLETGIRRWNEEGVHEDAVSRIQGFVLAACDGLDNEDVDQVERCRSFLQPEDDAT